MTEDGLATFEEQVQKLTDEYGRKIDDQVSSKEAEIMRV